MEHTPGPWTVDICKDREVFVLGNDGKSGICRLLPPKGHFTHGETLEYTDRLSENIANAALIAATHELLGACEAVLLWAKTPGNHGGNPYCHAFVKRAELAIKKAKGGS